MKKYLVYWRRKDGLVFTTNEEAENFRKALKNVSYFEKKTGYEIICIKEDEEEKS